MKLQLSILFAILIGFYPFFFIANSQAQVLRAEHYTIEHGLSQTSVNCLIQDSRGFIWIGTQDGLNKFDGYNFKVLKNDPADTNSLSNNFVNCIYEDIDGNIWVGTNYGLNRYNIYSEVFTHFFSGNDNINTLRENEVYTVYQDKSGYIWIKTENYLSRFNPRSNKFRHYEHYNDVFNFVSVNAQFSIFEDHKDQLWVGTKDGLNYFDRKLEIFKRYRNNPEDKRSLSNDAVKIIYEDSEYNLWIGTENGLNKFDWDSETFTRFYSDKSKAGSLSNNIINDIFEDKEGNLWIATNDGLNKYDKSTEAFKVYNSFIYNNELILTTTFTDIVQDHTNILWMGTFQGLLKLENKKKKFKLYNKSEDNTPLFSNNYVTAIHKVDDLIWIGTWGYGLHIFNPKTKEIVLYNSSNSSIIDNYIHRIFQDESGKLWLGTQNGLCFYNKKTNSFELFEKTALKNLLKNNRIYNILEDQNNNLWVASKFGLHHILEDTVVSYYHNPEDSTSLGSNVVYDIWLSKSNDLLWIATQRGLGKLNLKTNKLQRFERASNNCSDCFSSNEIFCIYEDTSNNYLWLGTNAGLNRFDLNTNQVKVFNEKDGLSNNLIYSILSDDSGNIWISTNKGLSKFNIETEIFNNFGISDGLQDFEFNHGASFKSEDGELFFGGIAGYNSFYPDSIVKNQNKPNIEITAVEVLADQYSQNLTVGKNRQIEVSYKSNLITIEFAALDFTSPEKNNYAYKLEGVEEEWIHLGNRRYATFTNLPPGKYTFTVKGSNSDNIWNEEGASIDIIVQTPIWKTSFAYLAYILISVGLIFWLIQYRTRTLRRSNQELKEKEQIAKQIAKQKEELTIKNKSITDSIVYAKRIQEALMPSKDQFKSVLPSSFILYKPKDIVSGDFYWINEKNDKIFVAVVDCTGHGVPGAFMSIIGFELLRNITEEQKIEDTESILRQLNNGVATTFGKTADKARIKDGMDIALCVIDKKKAELEFAGAFRPLYMIRNNKIEEIRGDRFSVGLLGEGESDEITKTQVKLQKNDIFYMFSDGYADQFGGPEGKKYKYRRFRHLLLTIHKLPLEQQLTYFDRSFEDWKGDFEQVDDVLILGFRPEIE